LEVGCFLGDATLRALSKTNTVELLSEVHIQLGFAAVSHFSTLVSSSVKVIITYFRPLAVPLKYSTVVCFCRELRRLLSLGNGPHRLCKAQHSDRSSGGRIESNHQYCTVLPCTTTPYCILYSTMTWMKRDDIDVWPSLSSRFGTKNKEDR